MAKHKNASILGVIKNVIRNQNKINRQTSGANVVFRDLFNKVLKMKYQFYQESAPMVAQHPFAKRSGSA